MRSVVVVGNNQGSDVNTFNETVFIVYRVCG